EDSVRFHRSQSLKIVRSTAVVCLCSGFRACSNARPRPFSMRLAAPNLEVAGALHESCLSLLKQRLNAGTFLCALLAIASLSVISVCKTEWTASAAAAALDARTQTLEAAYAFL